MAILQVEKTHYEKVQKTIERFGKISPPVVYDDNTSLALLTAANTKLNDAIDARNAAAVVLSNSISAMNDADDELTKLESSFRLLTGNRFGRESDEYVWAGGTRQSEGIEKAKLTRLEKQKTQAQVAEKAQS
jgi:hypothetical protein